MYGPYPPEQLAEFVRAETLLCREGAEEWKAAGEFPELSFLLSGVQVEAPPNVGWLVRRGGTDVVLGPFSKSKLTEMMAAGEMGGQDLVKHTDWEEWETLSKTKLVEHGQPAEPQEPPQPATDQPPSPEGFNKLLREATDEELLKEYRQNYKLYARRERKILKEELLRRGLIKKTLGLF